MFNLPVRKRRNHRRSGSLDGEQFIPSGIPQQIGTGDSHVDKVLQMQSLIGNQATQRLLGRGAIQRMPVAADITDQLGKPKKDTTFGIGKHKKVIKYQATKYKRVLETVDAYHAYLSNTLGENMGTVKTQFQQIITLMDNIANALSAYQGMKGKKARYMTVTLKGELTRERSAVSQTLMELMIHPELLQMGNVKLQFLVSNTLQSTQPMELLESNLIGTNKGGSKEVGQFSQGGKEGYYKENKNTLFNFSSNEEQALIRQKLLTQYGPDKTREMMLGVV
ncbi:MAG TPA: hypothetical protein VLK33_09095, partial [Terriglobales bacterium]|nr:hypothetical protein [Terriglobales bacterium]